MTVTATQVFTDSFTGAAGPISAPWLVLSGQWDIAAAPYEVAYPTGMGLCVQPLGDIDQRIVANYKTSTEAASSIGGIAVRVADANNYVGFELVKSAAESKGVIYTRIAGTDTERLVVPMPTLAYETDYVIQVDIMGDDVTVTVDNADWGTQTYTLNGTESAALTAGTDGGMVNFAGAANYYDVTGYTLANTGISVEGTGAAPRTVSLSDLPKGTYTVTWEGEGMTDTTTFDVVERYTFTVPEARAIDPELEDATRFPAAEIRHYRGIAEDEFMQITGRSSMTRARTVDVQADGTDELVLPDFDVSRIVSVVDADGISIDVSEWRIKVGKIAVADTYLVDGEWLSVTYEYGISPTPHDLKQAMTLRTRVLLFDEGKGVPDRATSFTPAGGGTFSLAQAGSRGWQTGVPDVDAVYKRYDYELL